MYTAALLFRQRTQSHRTPVIALALFLGLALGGCENPTDAGNGDGNDDDSSDHVLIDGIPQLTAAPTLTSGTVGLGGKLSVDVPVDADTNAVFVSLSSYDSTSGTAGLIYQAAGSTTSNGAETVNVKVRIPATVTPGTDYRVLIYTCGGGLDGQNSLIQMCNSGAARSLYRTTVVDGNMGNTLEFNYQGVDSLTSTTTGSTDFNSPTVTVDTSTTSAAPNLSITMVAPSASIGGTTAMHLFNSSGVLVASLGASNNTANVDSEEREFLLRPLTSQTNLGWTTNDNMYYQDFTAGNYTLYIWVDSDGVNGKSSGDYGISYPVTINGATVARFTTDSGYSGSEKVILPTLATDVGLTGTKTSVNFTDGVTATCTWHLPGTDLYSTSNYPGPQYVQATTISSNSFSYSTAITWIKGSWDLHCLVDVDGSVGKNTGDLIYDSATPYTLSSGQTNISGFTFTAVP